MVRVFVALFLSTAGYTTFMGAVAWESLRVSDRAGSPALVFAVSSAVSLSIGPLIGVLVDRLGPYRAYWTSQAASVVVASSCALLAKPLLGALPGLLLIAAAYGAANAMCHPAMQAILQLHATKDSAITLASRSGVVVALGFVLGYSAGGSAVDLGGMALALSLCAGAALISALCVPRQAAIAQRANRPGAKPGGLRELLEGARYLFRNPALRDAALASVLCYSIFHVVTALLAPFSKFVLGVEGSQFGFLRASWSGGSAAGSLFLSTFWGARQLGIPTRFLVVALLGVGLAVFSQSASYSQALVLIGCVGCVHSFCRAFLDGLLLQVTDPSYIGRVRSNINSLISGVSLLVFGTSALLEASALRTALAGTGATVTVLCLLSYARSRAFHRRQLRQEEQLAASS